MSPFEAIRHESGDSQEYWSARELAVVLGYKRWESFPNVVSGQSQRQPSLFPEES